MRIQTAVNDYKTVKKEKYSHTLSGGGQFLLYPHLLNGLGVENLSACL